MRFIPSNAPRIERKSPYSVLLRQKLESAIEREEPVEFVISQSFKSTNNGSKFSCYPTCSHKKTHTVFYIASDLKIDSGIKLTWLVRCDECSSQPMTSELLNPLPQSSNASSLSLIASSSVSCVQSQSNINFDLFGVVRRLVNGKLDEQERRLQQSSDPLQAFLNASAQGMLDVAAAYNAGVAAIRSQLETIQVLAEGPFAAESTHEQQNIPCHFQELQVVSETSKDLPEGQEVQVEVVSAEAVDGVSSMACEVLPQNNSRPKRVRVLSKKAQEMVEAKRQKKH